jgi:hypothetical protein
MTRHPDPELELLELGTLAPMVVPEVTRLPDGRVQVGCRYRCDPPATASIPDTIRAVIAHSEVRP